MSNRDPRGGGSRYLYEPFSADRGLEELEDYLEILRSLGPPEQVRQKVQALDELIEERRRRKWLLTSIKQAAIWATAVTAGWLAIRGLVAEIIHGSGR